MTVLVIIALVAINRRHKLRMMEHQERLLAIEKGQPIPVVPEPVHSKKNYPFAWPFVLIGFGLALLLIYIFGERDSDALSFGLISFFIGLGLLLSRFYGIRRQNGKNGGATIPQQQSPRAAGVSGIAQNTGSHSEGTPAPPSGSHGDSADKETGP